MGTPDQVGPLLEAAGLPASLTDALFDESWDAIIEAETDDALSRTGKDVGTPIIHFQPPDGVAFFGPVISRLPSDEQAVELWDHVVALASFPGFAEMKRSLRERPSFGRSVSSRVTWASRGLARRQPSAEEVKARPRPMS